MATTKKTSTTKKKRGPQCKCIELVQKTLDKEHPGVCVDPAISISMGAIFTVPLTKKHDAPRGTKVPTLIAVHCPLCGKKYIT